jgi:hypothetical protein
LHRRRLPAGRHDRPRQGDRCRRCHRPRHPPHSGTIIGSSICWLWVPWLPCPVPAPLPPLPPYAPLHPPVPPVPNTFIPSLPVAFMHCEASCLRSPRCAFWCHQPGLMHRPLDVGVTVNNEDDGMRPITVMVAFAPIVSTDALTTRTIGPSLVCAINAPCSVTILPGPRIYRNRC